MLHRFLLNNCQSLAACIVASLVFSGCATTTEAPREAKLPRRFVSTVSSSTGLFVPSRTTPILWNGTLDITDSAHLLTPERLQQVTNIVKDELKTRGYQFSVSAEHARFAMKAVLLMGKDADKKQLDALSGVAPELQEGDDKQSGALGVYFTDTDTQQIVWKSATEILTRSQLPEAQQIERIHYAVQQMLSGLPTAK